MRNCINARIVRLFGIIALAAIIGFSMVGCKSDDDSGVEGTWKAKLQDQPGWDEMKGMAELMGIKGDKVIATMEFKGGKVTVTSIDPKTDEKETHEGTYTQSGNTVTIKDSDGGTATATISGNKLTINDGEDDAVFKR